jgi:hypothetical protein
VRGASVRIKFTCGHANQGETVGHIGEESIYSPEYHGVEQYTDALAELYRSLFADLVREVGSHVAELQHAVEEDRALSEIVWRVYVRGIVCCKMHAQMITGIMAGCTKRFFEYVREGVKHPPTDAAHYRTDDEDTDDEQERILN